MRNIDIEDVDFKRCVVKVVEKGGLKHGYKIGGEGMDAVQDYIEQERGDDFERWESPALFLSSASIPHGNGRLNVRVINTVRNEVCQLAGVEDRTPHSARHAMGKHLMDKKGNIAAVQRQLGHKNAAYSMQYARITDEELGEVLADR